MLYNGDILNDVAFLGPRNVLEGKARELRAEGMGKKSNARYPLTPEEEKSLWKANRLGALDLAEDHLVLFNASYGPSRVPGAYNDENRRFHRNCRQQWNTIPRI